MTGADFRPTPSRAEVPLAAMTGVRHHRDPALPSGGHRTASVAALAQRLGRLLPAPAKPGAAYVVPDATLLASEAAQLGIRGADDLFGGVVPTRVVAGKAITHPVPRADSPHADGWSRAFAEAVSPHTLAGLSAFSLSDARVAALGLLRRGPVRLKPAWTDGGCGQKIVHDAAELDGALAALELEGLCHCGLVIEQNLADAITFSVGSLRLGGHKLAYAGTQSTTTDNAGRVAYGGSRLHFVRGGFGALADADLPDAFRRAAGHARAYDEAADRHFPGFFASRRNYDVVLGHDGEGHPCAGVLEQSWRIGGASGAELVALKAFAEDAALTAATTSCHEVYGRAANPPQEADVYYHADDPEVGRLTKYAILESRSHA